MTSIEQSKFGTMPDGAPVTLYTLRNDAGTEVRLTDYGATTVGVATPDRAGRIADVTLGFDELAAYLVDARFIGGTIGRFANRIAGGRLPIDNRSFALSRNENGHHLHGGTCGFHRRRWRGAIDAQDAGGSAVRFTLVSPDGDEGYPGRLEVSATHTLTANQVLRIVYRATTDQPTAVNLTHHSYWNLHGAGRGDIRGHELRIAADRYTPVDATNIPTGERVAVAETPFDFRSPQALATRLDATGGFDHNFVLRGGGMRPIAQLADRASGRELVVHSDAPGLQVYTCNDWTGAVVGRGGARYGRHCAVALEPQGFPNAPNEPAFPNTILRPHETYQRTIEFHFSHLR
jgi:aldose 1-epimerase